MSSNNNHSDAATNSGSTSGGSASDHGRQDLGQGNLDHPPVPLMHRTVDDILSAEFPPNIGGAQHNGEVLNNAAHGNIMEGLDDLFNDDFPTVGSQPSFGGPVASQTAANIALPPHSTPIHQPPPLPTGNSFPGVGSGQASPAVQHTAIQQQNRPVLQLPQQSQPQAPQVSFTPLPYQQQQQVGQQAGQVQLPPQHMQTTPRPIYQQPPQQPLVRTPQIQLPPQSQQPTQVHQQLRPNHIVPNGQPATPPVARPPTNSSMQAPPAAIAQAGSPLHHILSSISPATGAQLRNLFALLQSNAVTPNEFLARAETLLDPAQFEILDRIRRRQPVGDNPGGSGSGPSGLQQPGPISGTPIGSASANISARSAAMPSLPQHSIALPPVALPNRPVQQGHPFPTPQSAGMQTPKLPGSGPGGMSISLPPSSSTAPSSGTLGATSQAAPVRKRTTDANSVGGALNEGKTLSKRTKTEHQGAIAAGSTGAPAISLPSTPGPSTPGLNGAPGSSPFNRVSLPGQQKATTASPAVPGAGSAMGAGSSTSGGASKPSANAEKVNYDNITDVMGYVGVDLKEESDNIMRDNDGYSRTGGNADGQDRTRVQNFVNAKLLKTVVDKIATKQKLQTVDPDVVAYLAMAVQERLRGLTEQMIQASKHRGRTLATAPPPMYDEEHAMYKIGVNQDVKKQLLAIERVEREEETKRKEQLAERERRLAAGEDLDENGEPVAGGGAKKGKKLKEGGPGVSARNMTEEARKKVANQTALGFAGGSGRTYSWMMGAGGAGAGGGGGGAPSPLPSTPMAPSLSSGPTNASSPLASGGVSVGGGPLKPGLARGSTMPAASSSTMPGSSVASPNVPGSAMSNSPALASPSLMRGATTIGGGSMVLPPSTLGRLSGLRDGSRTVNVRDVLFCLERDRGGGGGAGSGQRVLIKTYAKRLR